MISISFSQETLTVAATTKKYFHQIELHHDNDFLQYTDRYYSTGNFITYRNLINDDSNLKRQNSFYIIQEIVTPSDIDETDIQKFDRPYAGYLGLHYRSTTAGNDWLFDLTTAAGVTGSWSGAEWLQNSFHSATAEKSRTATWLGQINNNVTFNIYSNFVKEWKLFSAPFPIYFAINPSIATGSKDLYAQADIVLYFGKRNTLQKSTAYNMLGEISDEIFIGIRVGQRRVFFNTLLEGSLLNDQSELVMKPNKNLFFFKTEFHYRLNKNDFKLFYIMQSPETSKTQFHYYTTLSLARCF